MLGQRRRRLINITATLGHKTRGVDHILRSKDSVLERH